MSIEKVPPIAAKTSLILLLTLSFFLGNARAQDSISSWRRRHEGFSGPSSSSWLRRLDTTRMIQQKRVDTVRWNQHRLSLQRQDFASDSSMLQRRINQIRWNTQRQIDASRWSLRKTSTFNPSRQPDYTRMQRQIERVRRNASRFGANPAQRVDYGRLQRQIERVRRNARMSLSSGSIGGRIDTYRMQQQIERTRKNAASFGAGTGYRAPDFTRIQRRIERTRRNALETVGTYRRIAALAIQTYYELSYTMPISSAASRVASHTINARTIKSIKTAGPDYSPVFNIARLGGRYHGEFTSHQFKSSRELLGALRSHRRNISKHTIWINNPTRKTPGFYKQDIRKQVHLIKHKWPSDIQRHHDLYNIKYDILKSRGIK